MQRFLSLHIRNTCTHARARARARAHTHTHARERTRAHASARERTHTHMHARTRTHTHTYTRTHAHMQTITHAQLCSLCGSLNLTPSQPWRSYQGQGHVASPLLRSFPCKATASLYALAWERRLYRTFALHLVDVCFWNRSNTGLHVVIMLMLTRFSDTPWTLTYANNRNNTPRGDRPANTCPLTTACSKTTDWQ